MTEQSEELNGEFNSSRFMIQIQLKFEETSKSISISKRSLQNFAILGVERKNSINQMWNDRTIQLEWIEHSNPTETGGRQAGARISI